MPRRSHDCIRDCMVIGNVRVLFALTLVPFCYGSRELDDIRWRLVSYCFAYGGQDGGRKKEPKDTTPKEASSPFDLSEEEAAKLKELKENLENELQPRHTDSLLTGFLRARSFDVKEAEKLFYLDMNYRKFLSIDNILDEDLPELQTKYNNTGIIGFDKEGSLVRVANFGKADMKGMVHSLSTINLLKIALWIFEHDIKLMNENNQKTGLKQDKFVFIIDLEGLSMNQIIYKPVFDSTFMGLKLLQDHYIDMIKEVYVINAPSFFSTLFKMFKPVLQDNLVKRLRIFDSEGWQEELKKLVDPDELPVYLGGNRLGVNDDPKCEEIIGQGGTIDESYYAREDMFLDTEDDEVVTLTIPAGSFVNYRLTIPKAGTRVNWHIQAKDNDIGIGIYAEPMATGMETPRNQNKKHKEEDMSKLEQITPVIRSQCQIVPEIGSVTLWKPMILILHLDNSYSWMNSKIVSFKAEIEEPPEEENASNKASETVLSTLNSVASCQKQLTNSKATSL